MPLRTKFTCWQVTAYDTDVQAGEVNVCVKLMAAFAFEGCQYGNLVEENRKVFGTGTPTGSVELWIRDPTAAARFETGRSYYLDIKLAD